MNKYPIFVLMALMSVAMSGCNKIEEMNFMIQESTEAIYENADAVNRSTCEIRRNQQLVEESNNAIRENRKLLEAASK